MSKTLTQVEEKKSFFGKDEKKLLIDPLNENNPITVQVLGVCSALAVTSMLMPSIVMAIAVIFVTAGSNITTSLLRNKIPSQVRMIAQLIIIATLVTIVELLLKVINYPIYTQLSVYIGLIITNCIVMGRLEAFAMANKPKESLFDGLGNGIGYGVILILVGGVREFFGRGSLLGFKIIGSGTDYMINTADSFLFGWYAPNGLMALPASAMFVIGVLIWIQRSRYPQLVDVS